MSHRVKSNGTVKDLAELQEVNGKVFHASTEWYEAPGWPPIYMTKCGRFVTISIHGNTTAAITSAEQKEVTVDPSYAPQRAVAPSFVCGHGEYRIEITNGKLRLRSMQNVESGSFISGVITYLSANGDLAN